MALQESTQIFHFFKWGVSWQYGYPFPVQGCPHNPGATSCAVSHSRHHSSTFPCCIIRFLSHMGWSAHMGWQEALPPPAAALCYVSPHSSCTPTPLTRHQCGAEGKVVKRAKAKQGLAGCPARWVFTPCLSWALRLYRDGRQPAVSGSAAWTHPTQSPARYLPPGRAECFCHMEKSVSVRHQNSLLGPSLKVMCDQMDSVFLKKGKTAIKYIVETTGEIWK